MGFYLVAKAIDEADASTLYRIAFSYAPFHCPDCAACYCGKHWKWRCFTDGPYSGVEGHCPSGTSTYTPTELRP